FSTTTASWVSPTFRLISASLLVHGAFGLDSNRGGRHAQHPVLVAIFADGLAEQQLAPATPFLLPAIARPRGHGKCVANVNRMVILVMLFRVQAASQPPSATAVAAMRGRRAAARAGKVERVVRLPVRTRL